MSLMPLNMLGAREISPNLMQFGIFLPKISGYNGNKVWVRIIHSDDQFLQNKYSMAFPLEYSYDEEYGDYWSATIKIDSDIRDYHNRKPLSDSAWGNQGKYIYWYSIKKDGVDEDINEKGYIRWITDPFARELGKGDLAAFTLGYDKYEWSSNELDWKIPQLEELVIYRLRINEFSGSVAKTVKLLNYIADIGVNCIEIMPIANSQYRLDRGYTTTSFFAIDEQFGNRKDFQYLIDEAHKRKIAVLMDVTYGHVNSSFAYNYIYKHFDGIENPIVGPNTEIELGYTTDYQKKFTRDFFFTSNFNWLDNFHVDGFRYDCVPSWYSGVMDSGYSNLVYSTYKMVEQKSRDEQHWQRFLNGNSMNFIQCAEHMQNPFQVLRDTYSNCAIQDATIVLASQLAKKITPEGIKKLGLSGFGAYSNIPLSSEVVYNGTDRIKKTVIQYIENHDDSRLICSFDEKIKSLNNSADIKASSLYSEADREKCWYKVQPYLIGLFTSKGIPMILQGQEFNDNYFASRDGLGQIKIFRETRWDYFYDDIGRITLKLIRKLIKIRRSNPEILSISDNSFYYLDEEIHKKSGVMVFERRLDDRICIIAINFSDENQIIPINFVRPGRYVEELRNSELFSINGHEIIDKEIPSNYGCIWVKKE